MYFEASVAVKKQTNQTKLPNKSSKIPR